MYIFQDRFPFYFVLALTQYGHRFQLGAHPSTAPTPQVLLHLSALPISLQFEFLCAKPPKYHTPTISSFSPSALSQCLGISIYEELCSGACDLDSGCRWPPYHVLSESSYKTGPSLRARSRLDKYPWIVFKFLQVCQMVITNIS